MLLFYPVMDKTDAQNQERRYAVWKNVCPEQEKDLHSAGVSPLWKNRDEKRIFPQGGDTVVRKTQTDG